MNIILVVFDSLRKDCVGCYGQPPWWKVHTPHWDKLAEESLVFDRMYPESLPTLPTRRALYTGQRVYPFHLADFHLKGDFVGAPGWGPIPEDQPTLAEILKENGYRTGLIADVYHMFKPSKNYWRGFDQWMFLRGQENDPYRSGPEIPQEELDRWLPREYQNPQRLAFLQRCLKNMHDRVREEDYFAPRVLIESARWLEQNRDADKFFLTIESFDPHEPWFVPDHYLAMYDSNANGRQWAISGYLDTSGMPEDLLRRVRANYSGEVTMCDRWTGHLLDTMRTLGMLDNTILIFTADHGHSVGDARFLGKRGYPSHPSVYDVPLMIRHPEGIGAGRRSDVYVQHTDVAAQLLDFAGIKPLAEMDGTRFWQTALDGGMVRDHVTVGWSSAITVIDDRWWLNVKIDGTGAFLYDRVADPDLKKNVADEFCDEAKRLFRIGVEDAEGGFPEYLKEIAAKQADAPGCSDLVARS